MLGGYSMAGMDDQDNNVPIHSERSSKDFFPLDLSWSLRKMR